MLIARPTSLKKLEKSGSLSDYRVANDTLHGAQLAFMSSNNPELPWAMQRMLNSLIGTSFKNIIQVLIKKPYVGTHLKAIIPVLIFKTYAQVKTIDQHHF